MANKTPIEWARVKRLINGIVVEYLAATLNPLAGCSPAGADCDGCYAAIMARRLEFMALANIAAGRDPGRKSKYIGITTKRADGRIVFNGTINTDPTALWEPFRTKKPTAYFFNSMSDLFHRNVPDDFIDLCYAAMALTPRHIYQVLTKRPRRMAEYLAAPDRMARWEQTAEAFRQVRPELRDVPIEVQPAHIWHGASAGYQRAADTRLPWLARIPGITFVSYEPALEQVAFRAEWLEAIDQIIVGGESGPGARPFDLAWASSTIEQCQTTGVAVFVKQLGSKPVVAGQPLRLGDGKGGDMDEWPEGLRIRQFPQGSGQR